MSGGGKCYEEKCSRVRAQRGPWKNLDVAVPSEDVLGGKQNDSSRV